MATYYVKVDTYWQNSPDYFVGPFNDRQAAQSWLDGRDGSVNLADQFAGDVKNDWRASMMSATEAKRNGMSDTYERHNVLPVTTRASATAIESAVRFCDSV
jgi:hypothetical protein